MSATTIFVIGIIAAAVLASAGVFVVAARREPSAGPITGDFDAATRRGDAEARRTAEAGGGDAGQVATLVREDEAPAEPDDEAAADTEEAGAPATAEPSPPPSPDPLLEREEISREEYAATRRKFLNRAVLGLFGGAFLGGQALAYLAFLWPKLRGGFGTPINAGNLVDIRREISGEIIEPKFVAAAQAYIVPIDPEAIAGSQFSSIPVVVGAEGGEPGVMALWQRCVHLGCRVPQCIPSQGFECPCHGSRYNFHGEYEAGPAPRNLDRFEVQVSEAGDLIVNTGAIFQTARAKNKTIPYPQGPSCI